MNKLEFDLPGGIGDNLLVRIFFDPIMHQYDQIYISHSKDVINTWRNGDPTYFKFLDDIGNLLFTTKPYVYSHKQYQLLNIHKSIIDLKLIPQKPNIDHLLCKGTPLDIDEEYIVITTKIRLLPKPVLYKLLPQLFSTLRKVSEKYKIVILGERVVEKSKEYLVGNNNALVYGIYEQIITNLPTDRIIDLTVPALGITTPNIEKIQQDCLIMNRAKYVITLGLGGNLWLAVSIATTVGFRAEPMAEFPEIADWSTIAELINNPQFPTAFSTKNWEAFLWRLSQ